MRPAPAPLYRRASSIRPGGRAMDDSTRDPGEPKARDDGTAKGDAPAADLTHGGHEPVARSEDPVTDEARGSIQDAFDSLEAIPRNDVGSDAAATPAEEAAAPG